MKAIILYMPVIHQGYLDLLERHKDVEHVYLLDESCIIEMSKKEGRSYFNRSMLPSIGSYKIMRILDLLGYNVNNGALHKYRRVWNVTQEKLLKGDFIDNLKISDVIILPNEDISEYFVDDYLKPLGLENKVNIDDNAFLRFNKAIPQNEAVVPDITMSVVPEFLREVARIAYKEAQKSSDWWRQVGAVLFNDMNWIILAGFNKHIPDEHIPNIYGDSRAFLNAGSDPDWGTALHAERMIFAKALKQGISTDGLSLYVTTYPCSGCAAMISQTGIKRIYYTEGYSMAQQAGDMLKVFGIEVIHIPKEVIEK